MPGKVVFVNRFFHPDLSATSQMLSDLAVRLARAGLDVHVICSRQLYENAAAGLPRRSRQIKKSLAYPSALLPCINQTCMLL